jgi:ankyrin repeat protein
MNSEVRAILEEVKGTPDFGYVTFDHINATNELGDNALHCLAVWGDPQPARILIAAGINVNQRGDDGETPLHVAASFGHYELVKLLLEAGADPHARTDGALPFTIARLRKRDAVCDLISEYAKKLPPDAAERARSNHIRRLNEQIDELSERIEDQCDQNA